MQDIAPGTKDRASGQRPKLITLFLLAVVAAVQGCAAVSSPVAHGVPVRRLPPEMLAESKADMQTIPLSLLRQPPHADHKIGAGDVLGIWVEGVLGERGQPPPVRVSETGKQAPGLGFPIPVRPNGTIALPLIDPIKVEGMTLEQAEDAIRKAYTVTKQILKPGRESIIVTLQQPRTFHILVIRQDSGSSAAEGGGAAAGGVGGRTSGFLISFGGGARGVRRGTGFAIDLPVYENDVLNALARTGGFPGTDAVNEIVVERSTFKGEKGRENLMNQLQGGCPPGSDPLGLTAPGTRKIRIPLRYRPGEQPTIRPEDVVLQNGDIVFIEARESDVFYTGGLLPSGEHILPRDTDLDVVEAITRIGGSINSGGISTANINGTLLTPGLGSHSPTQVSIIRKTPDLGQVTIRVDLDRALRDRRERILIQPQDLILLQETPEEGITRYFTQMFKVNLSNMFLKSPRSQGTATFMFP